MSATCARLFVMSVLAGCVTVDPPTLLGIVYDGRDDGALPLSGADISVVSPARGEVLGEAVTDDDGRFEVALSQGADGVAIEIRAPGYVTSVFHGNAPLQGELGVPDGFLFAVSEAELDSIRAQFSGCPNIDAQSGIVVGEVRVFDLVDPLTGESPLTSEGQVGVFGIDDGGKVGTVWDGCYLDEAGDGHDPTAEFTGDSGQFAIFGVEPGFHEIRAQWQLQPNQWNLSVYPAWVPEDEVAVLPQWPAWVEFGVLP